MEFGTKLLKKTPTEQGTAPFFYLLRASPQTPCGTATLSHYAHFIRYSAHSTAPTVLTALVAVLAVSLAPPMNSGADSSLFSISIGLRKKKAEPVVSVATRS